MRRSTPGADVPRERQAGRRRRLPDLAARAVPARSRRRSRARLLPAASRLRWAGPASVKDADHDGGRDSATPLPVRRRQARHGARAVSGPPGRRRPAAPRRSRRARCGRSGALRPMAQRRAGPAGPTLPPRPSRDVGSAMPSRAPSSFEAVTAPDVAYGGDDRVRPPAALRLGGHASRALGTTSRRVPRWSSTRSRTGGPGGPTPSIRCGRPSRTQARPASAGPRGAGTRRGSSRPRALWRDPRAARADREGSRIPPRASRRRRATRLPGRIHLRRRIGAVPAAGVRTHAGAVATMPASPGPR